MGIIVLWYNNKNTMHCLWIYKSTLQNKILHNGFFLLSNYEKNHLNSDGQQFYQYEKKKQLPPTSNHWTQKLDSLTVLTYKTDSHDFVKSDTKYHKPNPNPLPTELKEISTKLAKGGYEVFQ
jgi:hypothetical protein